MSLEREQSESLETKDFVTNVQVVSMVLLVIMAFGVVAGVLLAMFGVLLVVMGPAIATINISLLGMVIDTTSVGVACVAIGALVVVLTIRRVLDSLDILLKGLGFKRNS